MNAHIRRVLIDYRIQRPEKTHPRLVAKEMLDDTSDEPQRNVYNVLTYVKLMLNKTPYTGTFTKHAAKLVQY